VSDPRRVLIVTQYFWPETGAPQVRYDAITKALVELGVEVDVLTGMPNYPTGRIAAGYDAWRPRVETRTGVRIHRLPLFAYGGDNKWLRLANHVSFASSAFLGAVLDLDPDIVVVESPPLPLVVPAALIARRHGAPLVMYASDLWPDVPLAMGALHPGFVADRARDLESLSYSLSWRITVTSDAHLEKVAEHPDGGRAKLLLLPNGFDPDTFRPYDPAECGAERERLGSLADRALFMYAGTIGHAQALDTIVRAAEHLRGDARIGFVFIGDGPERAPLEQLVRELGLDSVLFIGAVPPGQVARYLAFATATLAPMRAAEFFKRTRPAKVIPSLACAKPVIFASRGESGAMLEREACGIVVPPEDPQALAGAITRLADDPDEARAMGERGRAFAIREFDFPTLVRGWWSKLSDGLAADQSRSAAAGGQTPA
jgi:glycosyltransferase involved in cell wall biosynthesis